MKLATSPLERGCADACAGHSSKDFESMGLPSYQHFRPSIIRQDQCPSRFEGTAALHCCFACAVAISIDENVAMQAAEIIDKVCFAIEHHMQWFNEKTELIEAASLSNLVVMGQKLGTFTAS